MQTLWSRAARNHVTCTCMQCGSNTAATAPRRVRVRVRQPGLAMAPTSRTFCHTATLATGFATDGGTNRNRNRNDAWDAAYAQLRESLVDARNKQGDEKLRKLSIEAVTPSEEVLVYDECLSRALGIIPLHMVAPRSADWDTIFEASGMELYDDDGLERLVPEAMPDVETEDLWWLLSADSRFPGTQAMAWDANTGQELVQHHLPPQSLWSFDHMREKALQRRHTLKKLALQELSIATLVLSLLGPVRDLSISKEQLAGFSPALRAIYQLGDLEMSDMRFRLLTAIRRIERVPVDDEARIQQERSKADDFVPKYSQDSDGEFYNVTQQLNNAIKETISTTDLAVDSSAMAMAKIAHNLLVSSAAPDVQTFNILITGLKRWRLPRLVDDAISSFQSCRIRPNEVSCTIILDHYMRRNDPGRFSKFVEKMRGLRWGLMLANPTITINEAGMSRLIRVNDNKVIQKVHPNPLVFNTLLRGLLQFAGIDRTLEVYYEMNEDGWGADVQGLTQLLMVCTRHADWQNGLYVWEEICSIRARAKSSHLVSAYANMLSLCSVTGHTTAFNHILGEAAKWGLNRAAVLDSAMRMIKRLRDEQQHIPSSGDGGTLSSTVARASSQMPAALAELDDAPQPESNTLALPTNPDPGIEAEAEVATEKPAVDPWSVWLEHELSPPKYTPPPPVPPPGEAARPNTLSTSAKSPDEAWTAWLEHELNIKSRSVEPTSTPEGAVQSTGNEHLKLEPSLLTEVKPIQGPNPATTISAADSHLLLEHTEPLPFTQNAPGLESPPDAISSNSDSTPAPATSHSPDKDRSRRLTNELPNPSQSSPTSTLLVPEVHLSPYKTAPNESTETYLDETTWPVWLTTGLEAPLIFSHAVPNQYPAELKLEKAVQSSDPDTQKWQATRPKPRRTISKAHGTSKARGAPPSVHVATPARTEHVDEGDDDFLAWLAKESKRESVMRRATAVEAKERKQGNGDFMAWLPQENQKERIGKARRGSRESGV